MCERKERFSVFIESWMGRSFEVTGLLKDDKVEELKGRIAAEQKIFADQQQLTFQGQELLPGKTLEEYQIGKGSTLKLSPSIRAGPLHAALRSPASLQEADLGFILNHLTQEQILFVINHRRPLTLTARMGDHFVVFTLTPSYLQNMFGPAIDAYSSAYAAAASQASLPPPSDPNSPVSVEFASPSSTPDTVSSEQAKQKEKEKEKERERRRRHRRKETKEERDARRKDRERLRCKVSDLKQQLKKKKREQERKKNGGKRKGIVTFKDLPEEVRRKITDRVMKPFRHRCTLPRPLHPPFAAICFKANLEEMYFRSRVLKRRKERARQRKLQKKAQAEKAAAALSSSSSSSSTDSCPPPLSPISSCPPSPLDCPPSPLESSPSSESLPNPKKCHRCTKKLRLTCFKCRCGHFFCSDHRFESLTPNSSQGHSCSFDFKSYEREKLREANPLVKPSPVTNF